MVTEAISRAHSFERETGTVLLPYLLVDWVDRELIVARSQIGRFLTSSTGSGAKIAAKGQS